MSLTWPRNAADVKAMGWIVLPAFTVPPLAVLALDWRLYFTSDAHIWNLGASLALGQPLAAFALYRAAYLTRSGLLSPWGRKQWPSFKQCIGAWLGMACALYFIGLMLIALHLLAFGSSAAHVGIVEKVEQCGRNCLVCQFRATVRAELMRAKVCIDALESQPAVGSGLTLLGRSTNYSLYLSSVKQ